MIFNKEILEHSLEKMNEFELGRYLVASCFSSYDFDYEKGYNKIGYEVSITGAPVSKFLNAFDCYYNEYLRARDRFIFRCDDSDDE